MQAQQSSVSTLMYTDGLTAFSIFVQADAGDRAREIESTNGATVAVSVRVGSAQAPHLVTLVGEIPMPTARRVVRSVTQVVR